MSARFRIHRSVARIAAVLVSSGAVATLLAAATPQPELQELNEALVTAKVSWPLEDYLEFPQYDSVVVSPAGTHLAIGWSEDSYQRRLNIVDFPSMKPYSSTLLQVHLGVADLRWLDEQRLVVQPDWPVMGLLHVRQPIGTILAMNIDGKLLQELNPIPVGMTDAFSEQRRMEENARRSKKGPKAYGPVSAVATRTGDADQLLFQTWWAGHGANTGGYGVFRLDLSSGRQEQVAALPLRDGRVIAGPDHRPALVSGMNAADEQVVYYLPVSARAEGKNWQLLARSGSGQRGLRPVAWTGNGEEYYALDGRDTPTRAVVVWNASDNTQRLLYRHPDADMDEVSLDPAGKPWMFSGTSHFPVYWYPDPAHPLAQLHRALVQQLAPEHVDIINATDDLSTAVVRVSSGKRPTVFLVVDVRSARSLTGMNSFPKLRGRRLSPVEAIEFHSRDGLLIHGYLTTPLDGDGKPRRGVPLLVIAHGGPQGEVSSYDYDAQRQLFASRGYAVLEVNARGTPGRGAAFEHAGDGKWGHEVQDDFADGVRWAIKDGVATAGHTCFYGTGYGAYSAMTAAAREPDLFQCVIGVAGVYDLPEMVRTMAQMSDDAEAPNLSTQEELPRAPQRTVAASSIEANKIPLLLQRAFGNSMEELRARSPINHAASIKAKVLLLHQHWDKQSSIEQMQAMNHALRSAGNRPEADTIGEEYEGYFTLKTRVAVYQRMLKFIDKQIGH